MTLRADSCWNSAICISGSYNGRSSGAVCVLKPVPLKKHLFLYGAFVTAAFSKSHLSSPTSQRPCCTYVLRVVGGASQLEQTLLFLPVPVQLPPLIATADFKHNSCQRYRSLKKTRQLSIIPAFKFLNVKHRPYR